MSTIVYIFRRNVALDHWKGQPGTMRRGDGMEADTDRPLSSREHRKNCQDLLISSVHALVSSRNTGKRKRYSFNERF